MAIFGKSFTYNGVSSTEFGVMLCAFDSVDPPEIGLGREIQSGETTSIRPVANIYGTSYSQNLEFTLSIMKNDNTPFKRSEIRKINAWLTSPKLPKLFTVEDYDNMEIADEDIDYYGIITSVTSAGSSDIEGLTYTLTCNAPYGFSKEFAQLYSSVGTVTGTFDCQTDELEEYVYPKLVITPKATGSITITNKTDGMASLTIKAQNLNKIYIDCKHQIIKDDAGLLEIGSIFGEDESDIYWFRLLPNINDITINGQCDLMITCRFPRKVGEY